MPGGSADNVFDFLEERGAATPRPQVAAPAKASSKIPTHVQGLDEALGGGIPEGNLVVVRGGPGTMKSILSFWILHQNAIHDGRRGVYVTLEQDTKSFQNQMHAMGVNWNPINFPVTLVDIGVLRREGLLQGVDWGEFLHQVARRARDQGASLLVLDSLEALETILSIRNLRHDVFRLFSILRELGFTVVVVSEETSQGEGPYTVAKVEDFLSDGIIEVRFHPLSGEEVQRRIRILKMRNTRHETSAMSLVWDEGALKAVRVISQQPGGG
jgi:KaiC/GvpD/RAD55 family RecA-like ATPase